MKRVAAAMGKRATAPAAKRPRYVPHTNQEILARQRTLTIDCNERNASAASKRLFLDTDFKNGVDGERKHDYYLDGKLLEGCWSSGSKSGDPFFAGFDREAVARKVGARQAGGIEKLPDARNAAQKVAAAAELASDAHRRASQACTRGYIVARAFAQPESRAIDTWRNLARVTDDAIVPRGPEMEAANVDMVRCIEVVEQALLGLYEAFEEYDEAAALYEHIVTAKATNLKSTWSHSAPFGTRIHAVIEKFVSGGVPWNPDVDERPPEGFLRFLADHPNLDIYRSEMLVFDEEHRIMGSIDAIFRDRVTGKFYLCDFKVTKGDMTKSYDGERGTHPLSAHMDASKVNKYAFQTNVYCYMFEKQEGVQIEEMFLLQFQPPLCNTYRKYPIARMDNINEVLAVITAHAEAQEAARARDAQESAVEAVAPAQAEGQV